MHGEPEQDDARLGRIGAALWNMSVDMLAVIDGTGHLTQVNPRWEEVLGCAPQASARTALADLVHPDDLEATIATVGRAGAPGRPEVTSECRVRAVDGRQRWLEWTLQASADGDEFFCIARDVTPRKDAEEEARKAARYARSLIEASLDPFVTISADGRIMDVNSAAEDMTGVPRDSLVGTDFADRFTDPAHARAGYRRAFREGRVTDYPLVIRHASGALTDVLYNASAYRDEAGNVAGVFAAARDITRMKALQRALEGSELRFRSMFRDHDAMMLLIDPTDGRIVDANPAAAAFYGYSVEEFRTLNIAQINTLPPDELAARLAEARRGGHNYFVFPHRLADGRIRMVDVHSSPVEGGGPLLFSIIRDAEDRFRAEQALVQLASHDPLTGLANRATMLDEITRSQRAARRSGRSTAVLMLDLDRFKVVNDSLGHGIGDELLVAAAKRIADCVRGGDLVARPGGDEFVIVMRELADPTEAARAAERIVQRFRAPFSAYSGDLYATVSVGVAVASPDSRAEDLIREADTAMYVAKDLGRDRMMVFNDDLRAAVTERMQIEGELRRAVERRELVVWYQPEIDLVDGSIIAAEALLRWPRPDGEIYSADRFVGIAEETGLILEIGGWVLEEACRQAAQWAAERPERPLTVRVNVSALQLAESGLLDALDAALASSGLDPTHLCLEITETALLRETVTARGNLEGIRARRIRIAIDDFGTGYASLAYLRQYPIDVVKIDCSFIQNITSSDYDRRLVAGMVALADVLGMTVTAEGVEHEEQAGILRSLGCPGAQGYLYSPAVPADRITALLSASFPLPAPTPEPVSPGSL